MSLLAAAQISIALPVATIMKWISLELWEGNGRSKGVQQCGAELSSSAQSNSPLSDLVQRAV